jgi:hypothetical protein
MEWNPPLVWWANVSGNHTLEFRLFLDHQNCTSNDLSTFNIKVLEKSQLSKGHHGSGDQGLVYFLGSIIVLLVIVIIDHSRRKNNSIENRSNRSDIEGFSIIDQNPPYIPTILHDINDNPLRDLKWKVGKKGW